MTSPDPRSPQPSTTPRRFGRDVALFTMLRIGGVGAGFLTSVIAARALGPDQLGAAGVGLTAGTVAAIAANGGLNIAAIYFLGRRPDARDAIVGNLLTLGLLAATLAALLVIGAAALLGTSLVGVDDRALVLATAILAAATIGFELSGSIVLGLDRRIAFLGTQAIEAFGSLGLIVLVFVVAGPTAAAYVLGAALAFLAAAAYAIAVTRRAVVAPLLRLDRRFSVEAVRLGLRGQVGNVLQFLNLRLDLLLVPALATLHSAGVYLIAVRMSEVVTQVASAASAFLFHEVARDAPSSTALTERTVRVTVLLVAASGLAIALPGPILLGLFFGAPFVDGAAALRITMVAMLPLAVTRVLAGDLKGRGRPGLVSIAAGAALVMTVVLDLLLIPPLGIEGAALASLLAYAGGAAVMIVAYARVTRSALRNLVPRGEDARAIGRAVGRLLEASRERAGPGR